MTISSDSGAGEERTVWEGASVTGDVQVLAAQSPVRFAVEVTVCLMMVPGSVTMNIPSKLESNSKFSAIVHQILGLVESRTQEDPSFPAWDALSLLVLVQTPSSFRGHILQDTGAFGMWPGHRPSLEHLPDPKIAGLGGPGVGVSTHKGVESSQCAAGSHLWPVNGP
jgi:hypothetical protein